MLVYVRDLLAWDEACNAAKFQWTEKHLQIIEAVRQRPVFCWHPSPLRSWSVAMQAVSTGSVPMLEALFAACPPSIQEFNLRHDGLSLLDVAMRQVLIKPQIVQFLYAYMQRLGPVSIASAEANDCASAASAAAASSSSSSSVGTGAAAAAGAGAGAAAAPVAAAAAVLAPSPLQVVQSEWTEIPVVPAIRENGLCGVCMEVQPGPFFSLEYAFVLLCFCVCCSLPPPRLP